jgi:transaldolase
MKLFLDTGNLQEIERLVPLGIVDGVTTNPSLLAKEPGEPRDIYRRICALVKGPVSAEVLATDADAMVVEGRELAAIDPHIVVKLPFGRAGLQACRTLSAERVRVNMTLIFSPSQALLSAKVGAAYVSPFIGRLDDISTEGMTLIEQIVEIFDNYDFATEVLVASVRHPMHVVAAARLGADVCTCPTAVVESMLRHPLTDLGLERFLKDWASARQAK